MTHYLLTVFHPQGAQAADAIYPSPESMQRAVDAVAQFNSELQESGQWVYAGGLTAPEAAHVVDATGAGQDEPRVTPGPMAYTGLAMGGFWVLQTENAATALQRAAQASAACGQRVELRALEG